MMPELLFAVFVALNVLDAAMTLRILKAGGMELNPLMRWFFSKMPPLAAMVLLKGAAITTVGYFLGELPLVAVGAIALVYLIVCVNNALVLRKMP